MRIDPYKISEEDLPLVVLADDRRGFLGWLIKAHSKGNYNHCMEMHFLGLFASQQIIGYKEIPIEKYIKPYIQLKFWKKKSITKEQKVNWFSCISSDLNESWWRRRYDFLGILGHLLRMRWLNNPYTKYCYERVAEHLREVLGMKLSRHSTPSNMNMVFNKDEDMEVYGYYFSD